MSRACVTVFGLDVRADVPLSFLRGASATPTGRGLDVCSMTRRAAAGEDHGFESVCDHVEPDGSLSFRIEVHPEAGYLLSGPNYGVHLLSADGRRLSCWPEDAGGDAWQRLLVAQVLPFAAVLQGLEVFHASAVVIDRQAIGLVGPSRAGKTSVALELCRLGAGFLADDVLVLEREAGELIGHPGSPMAGVDRVEVERTHRQLTSAEVVGANDRELLVRMQAAGAPAPLAALFFLDRRPDGPVRPRFEPIADARTLLAATFNFVLASPRRLSSLLDICALAAQRPVQRIVLGPSVDASQVGEAVAQRLHELA